MALLVHLTSAGHASGGVGGGGGGLRGRREGTETARKDPRAAEEGASPLPATHKL
ncbi:hypothetical protein STTU_3439 [Streptomyces sp. Tu6071]|nr:hypothetical protein STTU_3439 [Streptomyces sp. Tu6071]